MRVQPLWLASALASSIPSAAFGASPEAGHYANVHGLKMYYEIHGEGPALVLLHGGTAPISYWPEALEFFSKHYRVIAPEQMGHGHTADDPKRPFDYHAMAEDTVELMKQLKVESAFFVGWSDGGDLALDIAVHHPSLVKKLAVSGANIHPDASPGMLEWMKRVKPICGPGDKPGMECFPPSIHDAHVKSSPEPDHWPAFLQRVMAMWRSQPNTTKDQLAKISSPALIIAGDHDSFDVKETAEIFESIPGARLWILPNSTHFLVKQRAALFNATVDEFLKEVPAPKS